jgi:hypothetical protein
MQAVGVPAKLTYALVAPYRGGGFAIFTRNYKRTDRGALLTSDHRPYKHLASVQQAHRIIKQHGWTLVNDFADAEFVENHR